MATATKTKSSTKSKATVKANLETDVFEEVDELHELADRMSTYESLVKKLKKQYADVEKALFAKAQVEDEPADQPVTIHGKKHNYELGAKASKRTIKDMEQTAYAFEEQSEGLFMKVAKVNLADIDKYLSPAQIEKLVEVDHNGPRSKKFSKRI